MYGHRPLLLLFAALLPAQDDAAAFRAAVAEVKAFAAHHQLDKGIPGVWIAVEAHDPATGHRWAWATALGRRGPDPAAGERAAVDDVHRVASIGKCVTATLAMALAVRGEIDLDAPVRRWLPGFMPRASRAGEITLRQLLQHRSGLSRECPRGHLFDAVPADLDTVVRSLDDTALLFAPGTDVAYSNPGYAVLGRVLEVASGRPFAALADERLLQPLGLRATAFAPRADLLARQSRGRMWTLDGRAIPTPDHEFGCTPAVNLRATIGDLVALARSWLPRAERRVLDHEVQASMWEAPGALGFAVRELDGMLRVGHSGTAPGTACELAALPEHGLIAAAVVDLDFANDVAAAIVDRALRAMSAARAGERLPAQAWPVAIGSKPVRAVVGRYVAGDEWFDVRCRGDDLFFDPCVGIGSVHRADGKVWIADDPCVQGQRMLQPGNERIHVGAGWFVRRRLVPPPPAPAELLPLLGEYGDERNAVIVYEDEGRLGVLLQWHVRELPERVGPDRFTFAPGSFGGETLQFVRDQRGAVTALVFQNVTLPRRAEPAPGGFRIAPVRDVAELREAARAATPPLPQDGARPPDLVDLRALSPTLKFDIRYATADNFLGVAVYERAEPRLQREAAMALLAAHERLAPLGYGVLVFDAYRPWSVTKVFWEATPPALRHFVADPAQGSRHNRGCAVDLSLYELATGNAVPMPSDFDEFTARAYPEWPGGTARQRWHRDLLRAVMEECGFTVYEHEWWHFDHAHWREYPVLDDR